MNSVESDFVKWLAEKWDGGLHHSYPVTNSVHWKHYRESHRSGEWTCNGLRDALSKYSWAGAGYEANKAVLESFSEGFKSIKNNNRHSAHQIETHAKLICIEILGWGGVRNPRTIEWLGMLAKSCKLLSTLRHATESLKMGHFNEFSENGLLMNSGTTKIYSIFDSDEKLIIYDGRVGAALGYLATRYCEVDNIKSLPQSLKYAWGPSRKTKFGSHKRNPSKPGFNFPQLGVGADHHRMHAEMMSRASELILEVSLRTRSTPREWEAALFMLGYELPA